MYNSIHMQLVCSVCIEAVYQAVLNHPPAIGEAHLQAAAAQWVADAAADAVDVTWDGETGTGWTGIYKVGPQTIAELVIITPKALVYDTFTVTIVTGVISYKSTYNCGGAHCRCSDAFSLSKVWGTLGTFGDWCLWCGGYCFSMVDMLRFSISLFLWENGLVRKPELPSKKRSKDVLKLRTSWICNPS